MKDNFKPCLDHVLKHEGGWADHPKDPGGATMKGVTIGTFAQYKGRNVTKAELRAISDYDLLAIYRRNYWDKVRGDDLPAGLDLVAFDAAVNSGPARGARWLQEALGVKADGKIGPETLAFARAANVTVTIDRACDIRLGFLQRLKTWPTFGKGWGRRVAEVRAEAKRMATREIRIPAPDWAKEAATEPQKQKRMSPIAALVALLAGMAAGLWAIIERAMQ